MKLHKQNFVCWPSVGPQDIEHKQTNKQALQQCLAILQVKMSNDPPNCFWGAAIQELVWCLVRDVARLCYNCLSLMLLSGLLTALELWHSAATLSSLTCLC